jgi:itaconate CoA-transferase
VVSRLDSAGIANARLNGIADVVDHPQLAARERWRQVETSAGPVAATLPPANLDGVAPAMGAVPSVGQHTETVLRSAGYSASAIETLRASGAIG